MSRCVLLAVLAGLFVLGGCSHHRVRPVQVDARSHPVVSERSDSFRDDLNQSQSRRYRDSHDSVPSGPQSDISKLAEPVPKVEPRSRYGNKSPYTVLGHTYTVLPTARGYDERGIASFYGNKFHGYKTSSLENYDMYAFSAASTTLPLPSYVRVTNLQNGKNVVVRVNDRGPFHANRLIDLSYAAAVRIGIWPKGTGLVEVRGIDPSSARRELSPPLAVRPERVGIFLQVGAFADADNADRLAQRLRRAGFGPVQITRVDVHGRQISRVRVGPLVDVDSADQVSARIVRLGLPVPQVAVD